MRINTNISALQSYNALNATNNALAKSIGRLSTGLRINSAADDAAGLAISEKMRAQYRGLDQATSNAQDGISMIQTAEGALNETHSILQRMRELSVQAANDTLTQEDRSYIQLEVDQLKEEITRISTTTQFNKKQLLDGSAAAIWSSDDLGTRAIINGGLRSVDQFGQKKSVEGNYKITIKATPGDAEIQKSDIFKIKHKNVVMGVVTSKAMGVENVRVDGMPAGTYKLNVSAAAANGGLKDDAAALAFGAGMTEGGVTSRMSGITSAFIYSITSGITTNLNNGNATNLAMLFEVVDRNTATDANSVTLDVKVMGLDVAGNNVSYNGGQIVLTTAGSNLVAGTYNDLGITVDSSADTPVMSLSAAAIGAANNYELGSKLVLNLVATAGGNKSIVLTGSVNTSWGEAWDTARLRNGYTVGTAVAGKEVHFKQYYVNTSNGTVHMGDSVIEFNTSFVAGTASDGVSANFEAAYVGQIAKSDVALRDLDKFWDANGKFILQDPQTLSLVQGDGKTANVTLYSTDTIEDVRKKLNDGIANGLGQGKYATNNTNNFVSFVETPTANTSESVAGTFVVRSLIPGEAGKVSISGDEDIIKAFSLNVIQDAKESTYEATIVDAHSGNMVASGVKVTGNKLVGVLNENVDVIFDSMANTSVSWDGTAKKFNIKQSAAAYETVVHLADNTTVFQIGANEGEDMSVDIGNMSAEALGVSNIIVTDRESAARAITQIDSAINKVSRQRAKLGGYQNRLEHTISNLTTSSTNLKSSESRIRDTDMAKEMMEFTKLNILSSAGNSMLAQANNLPQNVLYLIR